MSATIDTGQRLALPDRKLDLSQTLAAEVATGEDPGTITGTACRYGVPVDRGWGLWLELVAGCFTAAVRDPARVLVLWQHDVDEPIGRLRTLTDTGEALRFAGWITDSEDVPNGRRALSLLRDGIMDQVSVGFDILKYERVEDLEADTVTYRILKARLRELSTVTFGAFDDEATVEQVFSQQAPPAAAPSAAVDAARLRARMAGWTL